MSSLAFKVRNYQSEMFERSLKGNVIIAMDTGSGKTAIAVLRIIAELDRCPPEQKIWFLAPTVALCDQQHNYIQLHIPAMTTRLLVGSDNVDRWSEQRIWDAALKDVRIVVSTHAVLADALSHGFVKISDLALLVFDEAHHCIKSHPANKIMQDFYHPTKKLGSPDSVPNILGLSASPILRSKLSELGQVEANMDSLCITPRLHRQELLQYVHHPAFERLDYAPCSISDTLIPTSPSLRELVEVMDEVLLQQTVLGQKVEWVDQLVKFCRKATHIYSELGHWAVEYFISQTIKMIERKSAFQKEMSISLPDNVVAPILRALAGRQCLRAPEGLSGQSRLSHKVERLLEFLELHDPQEHSVLVFVRQRAVVSVLFHILSSHPRTACLFQCATFVGMSNNSKKKYTVSEMFDLKAQHETINEFRTGKKNLVIATDVLEEGIDVTACNIVICFDPPPTLKSFIQRRGRARKENSKFAIMMSLDEVQSKLEYWQELERLLIKTYQDENRIRTQAVAAEDEEEQLDYKLSVPSTGATLTADSTLAHLHHFCAKLPRQPYVEMEPVFFFEEDKFGLVIATVTLPSCVASAVRSIQCQRAWKTERAAAKDASFQSYTALYRAGLLNENLLPLLHDWQDDLEIAEELPAVIQVEPQLSLSAEMRRAWSSPSLHHTRISVKLKSTNTEHVSMIMVTPSKVTDIPSLTLYWDMKTTFTVGFNSTLPRAPFGSKSLESLREITQLLHQSSHSYNNTVTKTDFVFLFSPEVEEDNLKEWFNQHQGSETVLKIFQEHENAVINGFVRSPILHGSPSLFRALHLGIDGTLDTATEVECVPLPKRRNFIQPNILSMKSTNLEDASTSNLRFRAVECTADRLGIAYAKFNLFIPSILQHIEIYTAAEQLCKTILASVPISNVQHIVTAIMAPSANWITNYQSFEFIGDTVLKFVTSVHLFAKHSTWPEGYLSKRRDSLVSNNSLASAAQRRRLGRYVQTEARQQRKWHPPCISDDQEKENRPLAMKLLADVVEALIGAAFVDSGLRTARSCINIFLPDIGTTEPEISRPPSTIESSINIQEAYNLLGYQFQNRTLLAEALTHATFAAASNKESYQRLEFLGDAVLDFLIVDYLAKCKPVLSQGQMTRLKAALVNGALLGFICMDYGINRTITRVEENQGGKFFAAQSAEEVKLWTFMRHHSEAIADAQRARKIRYDQYHTKIRDSLQNGTSYPWAMLAQLHPDKFYSDMIESIIGAIFVDSRGNLAACQNFVDNIGLGALCIRMTESSVDVVHPRTALQRLAGSKKVNFEVDSYEDSGEISSLFRCKVLVDEVVITSVERCESGEAAIVVGADTAIRLLSCGEKTAQVPST